jgi:hypothetical protein
MKYTQNFKMLQTTCSCDRLRVGGPKCWSSSLGRAKNFYFISSTRALGHTQPPIQ